jgi:thiamine biosynthesis lipoprotein
MSEHDITFDAMGSHVRLVIGEPGPGMEPAEAAAEDARAFVEDFAARLSRFRPDSELSRLNADPRGRVPASPLLRAAVEAGLEGARRSAGLVDPTLVREIEAAGYAASRAGVVAAPLRDALREAPPRQAARPHPDLRWRQIAIDEERGEILRPPGVLIDTGGAGKGLAADMVAARLRGYSRFVVDCGGDIRIGGTGALVHPYEIFVEHPLTLERAYVLRLGRGGVATSGLNVRIWRDQAGRFAHHLLDPSTGLPAWTGLVGVTALGDTTVEAETLSKVALLSGPDGGREVLSELGGLMVHDDGSLEPVGPLAGGPWLETGWRAAA